MTDIATENQNTTEEELSTRVENELETSEDPPAKKKSKGVCKPKQKKQQPAIRRVKGVRRPYRRLPQDTLLERRDVMRRRTDNLEQKISRSRDTLSKIEAEVGHRESEGADEKRNVMQSSE